MSLYKYAARDMSANQASFINSKIHKEVMRRTRLRNNFIDSKSDVNRINIKIIILKYVTQRTIKSFGEK